jgi:hypothetical protein
MIVIGMVGIVFPDGLTTLRRAYFVTPGRLFVAGAVRLGMGLVLILASVDARWPMILRLLGIVVCLQALSATIMGPEHARAILEWESNHTVLLRAGALIALVSGAFVASAVTRRSTKQQP